MNSDVEPPQDKTTTSPPSFSWIPNDIIINCLARISRSYYPKLSLVSKTFRSLISSPELYRERYHLKTQENVLYVCLQLPDRRLPSWYSLWIKLDQTLTSDMDMEEKNKSIGDALLVEIPSSHSPRVPSIYIGMVGSKHYAVRQYSIAPTSSPVWVCNVEGTHAAWREAPSMKVARDSPVAGILDGKIYVMGGCDADESTNWAEVLDTKTQTWESLPDPGPELRFSLIKTMNVIQGKVYVRSSVKKNYVYDPKQGRWDVAAKALEVECNCVVESVWYACIQYGSLWYLDTKRQEWRKVKGLEVLKRTYCGGGGGIIAIANYGGKLLLLWDMFEQQLDSCQNKDICCSVIALEQRNGCDDQVWGKVECSRIVLTVPSSYIFLRCQVKPV
ncbi:hypothetical protein EUTSA_v10005584mg [Eutrema salsugineum]|uniref:F-box domain-containing protein n=1 Tax=Eutrema salsugineum TaxID=72664 RepID=V4K5Z2_EUTSA|nr:putative F-box/kelch-repeat protein At4g39756 [Eutrema salsugineum]ESQ32975.1 hypothetical protein EUTSA_v10005584mg [Eutrema salsugineum]